MKIKKGDLITLKRKYKDNNPQNTGIVVMKHSDDYLEILFENGTLELKYSGHISKFYQVA